RPEEMTRLTGIGRLLDRHSEDLPDRHRRPEELTASWSGRPQTHQAQDQGGVQTLLSTARTTILAGPTTRIAGMFGLAPVCSHLPTPALTPMGIDGPFYPVDGGRRQSPHTRSKSVGPVAGVRGWLKSRSEEWRRSARLLQHKGSQIEEPVVQQSKGWGCSDGSFAHPSDPNLT